MTAISHATAAARRCPARPLVVGAIGGAVVLWASAFVAIRSALPALGAANLVSARLLLAALAFAALAPVLGVRRPRRSELPLLAALGATGYTGYQLLLSSGEEHVSAGTAALLFASAPVLATVLAGPILGERMTRRRWVGLAIAVGGAGFVALGQQASGGLGGAALVLAAAGCYGLWVVLQKRALATMPLGHMTAWATWFGAALTLPVASGVPHAVTSAPAGALAELLFLGLIVTIVPFLLWGWALARLAASTAAPALLLIGPCGALMGWMWLAEAPAPATVLGGLVTIAGVAVANGLVQRSTAKRLHLPPVSTLISRSRKVMPEPATRSFTVEDARTSPGLAAAATRGATWTARPLSVPWTRSHSPV
jgi:terminal-alkyne amino-acid exporter